ncbi:hypothetical protein EDD85DRAFT_933478 [Armillaria nabsnona]|nr:hypothetical protein EDD85DRAFT_933478 [Armillaria nabsnona]
MEDYRPDAAKDIKYFQQVSLKYYESYILPASVYSDHVDAITEALEDNDVLKKLDDEKKLRWADFLNDPKDNRSGEDETFKSMATIAAAIVRAAQEVLPPRLPAKYPKTQLALRVEQRRLFNAFFPRRLEGSAERRHFFVLERFKDETVKALPTEHKSVVKVLLSIHEVLVDHYEKVENLKDFPQHEQFNQVYGTEPPGGLLAPFEAAAKEAYSGDTQSLFSDVPIIITRSVQTESSPDDEEPPTKTTTPGYYAEIKAPKAPDNYK